LSATGQLLLRDHQRMDELMERLLDDIHRGEWSVCQSTWSTFERQLLQHFEAEETFLLPALDAESPEETAALRTEHANVRRLLADMGVRIELHTLREEHVRRFIEMLKAHAAREEALLYRQARDLPADIAETLAQRCASR